MLGILGTRTGTGNRIPERAMDARIGDYGVANSNRHLWEVTCTSGTRKMCAQDFASVVSFFVPKLEAMMRIWPTKKLSKPMMMQAGPLHWSLIGGLSQPIDQLSVLDVVQREKIRSWLNGREPFSEGADAFVPFGHLFACCPVAVSPCNKNSVEVGKDAARIAS